jgi:mono/diheme cytochrome c family protein
MKLTRLAVSTLFLTAACTAADVKSGKALYTQHCQNCHGANGVANPQIVKMMKSQIPNLGSAQVQKMSDADLKKVITDGKGKMPPIRSVTGKSLDEIVAYIRTLKK